MNLSDIDKIICLCLDKRVKLWSELDEQVKSIFGRPMQKFIVGDGQSLDGHAYDKVDNNEKPPSTQSGSKIGGLALSTSNHPMPETSKSWMNRPNAYNAWKSHKEMMNIVLDEGASNALFLEDDAYFTNDFVENLQQIEYEEWDGLWLGSYHRGNQSHYDMYEKFEIKLSQGHAGFHACILKRNVIEEVVKHPPIGPIDLILGSVISSRYDFGVCVPNLAIQRSTHSFVEDTDEMNGGILMQYNIAKQRNRIDGIQR